MQQSHTEFDACYFVDSMYIRIRNNGEGFKCNYFEFIRLNKNNQFYIYLE